MASSTPSRRLALWAFATLSFLSTIALITFLAILSVDFTSNNQSIRALSVASCALELVSLLIFFIWAWRESMVTEAVATQQQTRKRRRLDVGLSSLFAVIAAAATIGTVAWMSQVMSTLQPIVNLEPKSLMGAVIALLMTSLASETAAFALLLLESRDGSSIVVLPPPEMVETAQTWPERTSTVESKTITSHKLEPMPPLTSDSSSISFRSSLTISTRPNSSRNPLISSRPPSSSEASHFDSWDTSNVPTQLRDAVHSRSTPQSRIPTMLPPIPGSRPASPAKALDGPFLPPSPHATQIHTIPVSPDTPNAFYSPPTSPALGRPPLATSPSLDSIPRPFAHSAAPGSSDSLPLPRTYSQTSMADSVSHLPSRGIRGIPSEENIHPLFRASSPTPPPGASVGTILTAASIEEAVKGLERRKTSKEGLRSRAGSASGSYPQHDSQGGRRRARTEGKEAGPSSPLSRTNGAWTGNDDLVAEAGAKLRTEPTASEAEAVAPASEPPSRKTSSDGKQSSELKPDDASDASSAIPDFIVAAAQRRSFEGFERRRSTRDSNRN